MSRVDYRSSAVYRAWDLPRNPSQPHRRRTCGFWIRDTIDRPLEEAPKDPASRLYEHLPLPDDGDHIRLLVLHAGREGDPISATLIVAQLRNFWPFESVSYVWGNAEWTTLNINGHGLPVPTNLMTALTYLRLESEDRILWADAICISQNDVEEKSRQVALMRDIYATASRVIIWLGEARPHSVVGMEILRSWSTTDTFDDHEAPWLVTPPEMVKQGLLDILGRSWWMRYWVVQEGSVAREVLMLCGSDGLRWQNNLIQPFSFMRAVKLAVLSPHWRAANLEDVELEALLGMLQMQLDSGRLSSVWSQRSRTTDLLEIAYSTRHRKTTDIRDRIFSLVGMVPHPDDAGQVAVVPDYTLSAEEAYSKFSAAMTKQTRDMCRELSDVVLRPSTSSNEPPGFQNEEASDSDLQIDTAGGDFSIASYLDQIYGQVTANVRSNKPGAAAKLLEEAAMLLRSEQFSSK